jgi:hypothetical protein
LVVTWAYNAGTNTATASGAGSTNFAALVAADVAGGWGKYTADATGTQIICAGKIVIGDSSNACVFTDTNKQIFFNGAGGSANWIRVKTGSTLTLGTLLNAGRYSTNAGCSILFTMSYGFITILADSGSAVSFYSCLVVASSSCVGSVAGVGLSKVWNCVLNNVQLASTSSTSNIFNVYIQINEVAFSGLNGVIDTLVIRDSRYVALVGGNVTAKNVNGAGLTTKTFDVYGSSGYNVYLINPIMDAWTFNFLAGCDTKVYRQYEFDLTTDAGATVTLTNNAGTVVFTETTATGTITTQTVSRGYYAQATGDTLQDYAPHTLTITLNGKQTYTDTLTLTEKTKLDITLQTAITPITSGTYGFHTDAPSLKEKTALQLVKVLLMQKERLRKTYQTEETEN